MAKIRSTLGTYMHVGTDEPLAASPTAVRLPVSFDMVIRQLGEDKTPWLRRVITEAAQRELMGNAPQAPGEVSPAPGLDGCTKVEVPPLAALSPAPEKPKRRGRKPKTASSS